jgi:FkbM family methyltransferase
MASSRPHVTRSLRRLNDSPLVKGLGPLGRAVNRLAWLAVETRLVKESGAYLANTFRKSRDPRRYHLRSSGSPIHLRHHTGDVAILRKFAAYRYYDLPDEVEERLRGRTVAVLDLGANIGLFGVHARAHADVSGIVSFEPDEQNAAVIDRVIADNGGPWELIRACASNRDGETRFAAGRANLSRISDVGVVVPVVDAIPYLVAADLAKVNIEGAEWDILADERFVANAPEILILEYHEIANPEPDIHALVNRLLVQAGYTEQFIVNRSEENGLIWAWKAVSSPTKTHVSSEEEAAV